MYRNSKKEDKCQNKSSFNDLVRFKRKKYLIDNRECDVN